MEENSTPQRRVKVTIKWKNDRNVGESSAATDEQNDVQNPNASSSANLPAADHLNDAQNPNASSGAKLPAADHLNDVQNPNASSGANPPAADQLNDMQKSNASSSANLPAADPLNEVQNPNASSSVNLPGSSVLNLQDQGNFTSAGASENHSTENEENPTENSQKQLVPYDPAVNGTGESGAVPDPVSHSPSSSRPHPLSNQAPKVLPSIGVFTVQCANCFKWRLIPTKEKYEEIREHIMIKPFYCETGRAWRPDVSCDDPPDIKQDGSRLWAIDKPSIAQPPPGWQRLLRIRSEGSSKFADVYYVSPTGKRLRSMVEVQKYLDEHPEYKEAGIALSKFSFQIPRPLQDDYVRKRPAPVRPAPMPDANGYGMAGPSFPIEVQPISWMRPDVDTDVQLNRAGPSTSHSQSNNQTPETQPAKKRKKPAQQRSHGNAGDNENGVKDQESHTHLL